MRKSRAETAETRERIVDSAATSFQQHGIEGTSLSDLMAAAGLTHGGFYRHFESKDQLVFEACQRGLEAMVAGVRDAAATQGKPGEQGAAGLATIADTFLSAEHRDDRVAGCPLVTIGSELARSDAATRRTATEGIVRLVNLVSQQFHDLDAGAARARAFAVVSMMVGGATLARIVDDPGVSDDILRDVRRAVVPD